MLNFVSLKLNAKKQVKWDGLFIEAKILVIKNKKYITLKLNLEMEG